MVVVIYPYLNLGLAGANLSVSFATEIAKSAPKCPKIPKIQGFWSKMSRKNPQSAGDLPRLVPLPFRHTYTTKILGVGALSARSWDFLNTDSRNFDLHPALHPYRGGSCRALARH